MRLRKTCTLVLALGVLGGCATQVVNHPLDTRPLARFHRGVTTEADVEQVYGAPSRRTTDPATGQTASVYAYRHETTTAHTARVHSQKIVFVYDAHHHLLRFTVSNGNRSHPR